jgi:hypothetical protein
MKRSPGSHPEAAEGPCIYFSSCPRFFAVYALPRGRKVNTRSFEGIRMNSANNTDTTMTSLPKKEGL